jgi:hypothetical protein
MTIEEIKNSFGEQFRVIRCNTSLGAETLLNGGQVVDEDGNTITMRANDVLLVPDDLEERIAALELRVTALENK